MRFSFVLTCALGACGGSSHETPGPDAASDADTSTKITITSDATLMLAAFRDGVDAPWQPAKMNTATSYELAVHGPYVFAVVYDSGVDPTTHGIGFDQYAQTLDDDHTISIVRTFNPMGSAVTGTVVEPARVYLGDDFGISFATANWNLALTVSPGPHDLFAFSADHAYVHHALDATHDVALGTLDVNTQGVPLETVAFTAVNKTATDVLTSRAAIETPTTYFASVSPFGNANATKVVPDSLLGATDRQSVSVFATDGGHQRTRRQPYHAGGSTSYTLPSVRGGVSWTTTPDLTVHWTQLAPTAQVDAVVFSEVDPVGWDVFATSSFLAATHVTQFVFDTTIPGFQSAWKIDTAKQYRRELDAETVPATSTVDGESWSEELNVPPTAPTRSPRRMPRNATER